MNGKDQQEAKTKQTNKTQGKKKLNQSIDNNPINS